MNLSSFIDWAKQKVADLQSQGVDAKLALAQLDKNQWARIDLVTDLHIAHITVQENNECCAEISEQNSKKKVYARRFQIVDADFEKSLSGFLMVLRMWDKTREKNDGEIRQDIRGFWEIVMSMDGDEHAEDVRLAGIEYIQIYCEKYGANRAIDLFKKYGGAIGADGKPVEDLYQWTWFAMAGIREVENELRKSDGDRAHKMMGLAYLGFDDWFDWIEKNFFGIDSTDIEFMTIHLRRIKNRRAQELAERLRFRLEKRR